ncbi:UNKNOWN [Stylonychia lemnae]|uniref:Uncharacterized protein n=1 Tax=Stylonychia lemnae TaxID=5949 RepID=A0A078B9F8_STYLE|nr:UNKNOWN [Stylonychia lemnae]|eukprot:CDW90851.1 UNKNOWN [Stylonychia lemnae]
MSSEQQSSGSEKFNQFIEMNKVLLNCYSKTLPVQYALMEALDQKDFCYRERIQIEEYLMRGKIAPRDFFAAAREQL